MLGESIAIVGRSQVEKTLLRLSLLRVRHSHAAPVIANWLGYPVLVESSLSMASLDSENRTFVQYKCDRKLDHGHRITCRHAFQSKSN